MFHKKRQDWAISSDTIPILTQRVGMSCAKRQLGLQPLQGEGSPQKIRAVDTSCHLEVAICVIMNCCNELYLLWSALPCLLLHNLGDTTKL